MSTSSDGAVRSGPLVLLRLEGAVLFAALTAAYGYSGEPWSLFAILFFVPDLGMLGYLANPRLGAVAYDVLHTTTAPALLAAFGLAADQAMLAWIGAIWAAHIGFDRMLGFGLKYASGFRHTHLGGGPGFAA